LRLRNILFNNPRIVLIAARAGADEACWDEWTTEMRRSAGGLVEPDFAYVRRHFHSFREFAAAVEFLRSATVEGVNNKRWSSQFLFPFGPSALYEDLNVTGTSVSTDRRFFGRTGELLYLMLCRSGRNAAIRDAVCERFLNPALPYGRLVSVLQGSDEPGRNPRAGCFLPYEDLPDFTCLADDWLAILGRSLPGYDALPHLVTITGLHLLLYLLRRAHATARDTAPLTLVAEILSPKRTVVRDLSANSYARNNVLPERALAAWINDITKTDDWVRALSSADPAAAAKQVLQTKFNWPDDEDDPTRGLTTPASLLEGLQKRALERHRQHLAKCHGNWGRAIGLSSRRASRRIRYAPTDSLLKTLVICCVDKRLEFKSFVALLFQRYGLLIGDQHADEFTTGGDADLEAFADNASRLEERLTSLGLVHRLSDQCAYVKNPFSVGGAR
jgi:hypothetical protein